MLAHGYNYSVDWWGLGVLLYVLLTGRQPFSSPKTEDPMVVMRRIVDENWQIKYPPYLSAAAKARAARAPQTGGRRRSAGGRGDVRAADSRLRPHGTRYMLAGSCPLCNVHSLTLRLPSPPTTYP